MRAWRARATRPLMGGLLLTLCAAASLSSCKDAPAPPDRAATTGAATPALQPPQMTPAMALRLARLLSAPAVGQLVVRPAALDPLLSRWEALLAGLAPADWRAETLAALGQAAPLTALALAPPPAGADPARPVLLSFGELQLPEALALTRGVPYESARALLPAADPDAHAAAVTGALAALGFAPAPPDAAPCGADCRLLIAEDGGRVGLIPLDGEVLAVWLRLPCEPPGGAGSVLAALAAPSLATPAPLARHTPAMVHLSRAEAPLVARVELDRLATAEAQRTLTASLEALAAAAPPLDLLLAARGMTLSGHLAILGGNPRAEAEDVTLALPTEGPLVEAVESLTEHGLAIQEALAGGVAPPPPRPPRPCSTSPSTPASAPPSPPPPPRSPSAPAASRPSPPSGATSPASPSPCSPSPGTPCAPPSAPTPWPTSSAPGS